MTLPVGPSGGGPTRWRAAELMCPPALRPAVVLLLAMVATPGTSTLHNVYAINRGHQDLPERLNSVGAEIERFRGGSLHVGRSAILRPVSVR